MIHGCVESLHGSRLNSLRRTGSGMNILASVCDGGAKTSVTSIPRFPVLRGYRQRSVGCFLRFGQQEDVFTAFDQDAGFGAQPSIEILASRMMGPQVSVSSFTKAASSRGEEPTGTVPFVSIVRRTSAWRIAALRAACSRWTISLGVFAGAYTAVHPDDLKSCTPEACMVGTSGSTERRSRVVTARARSAPAFMCGSRVETLSHVTSTRPAMRSPTPSEVPR